VLIGARAQRAMGRTDRRSADSSVRFSVALCLCVETRLGSSVFTVKKTKPSAIEIRAPQRQIVTAMFVSSPAATQPVAIGTIIWNHA
jgi:hypothetical protein